MKIALRGDIPFPFLSLGEGAIARFGEGLDILLFGVKYLGVEKISRASMGGSTTVSFFV